MNQLIFTISQQVSAVVHVSVATATAAVTVALSQGTLLCSVCHEDTDSQSVSPYGTDCRVRTVTVRS